METARILLVDDEPMNLHVLIEALKDSYELLVATSGNEAIKLAGSEPQPDLILLDIMMPEMDGYEVIGKLKDNAQTKDIPVIFVSALSEAEDEAKGLGFGAVDYITKPFNLRIAKARIKTHLDLRGMHFLVEELLKERTRELNETQKEYMKLFHLKD
jgi:putative two-component system response regulator